MRHRLQPWFAAWCGSLVLAAAGCGRANVVRAPTRVVDEEPEAITVRVARASPEEDDVPTPTKETPAAETTGFHFPADRGGELLSKELTPGASRPLAEPAPKPRRGTRLPQLESPEVPLPPSLADHAAPFPSAPSHRPLMPRLVTPEALFDLPLEVALPQAISMPSGARTREPSVDVQKPAPLPILGQPTPDRASLADATADASAAAVLAAPIAVGRRPVRFQRQGVPDPFENHRLLRIPLPPEPTVPVTASPRLP
jgi:hypothetical protein